MTAAYPEQPVHPEQPGHRFTGMESELNEPPLPGEPALDYRYRGTCACGHADPWTADKDGAWEKIADHLMPFLLRDLARIRRESR